MSAESVQDILTSGSFGYNAAPFEYRKISAFGDVEAGVRFGLVQTEATRLVIRGLVRLPTGRQDSPDNFIDIAPADRQTDISAGLEAYLSSAALSLGLAADYTRQMPGNAPTRLAPPDRPITPASSVSSARVDRGDFLQLSAFPGVRLSQAFTVYAAGTYFQKQADTFAGITSVPGPGDGTAIKTLTVGGGIHYRSLARAGAQLPVEAGLSYAAVLRGSGGFAPKSTTLTMYLRFFYSLW
jgi:hypothetical protein